MSEHPPPQEAHWPEGAIFTLGHSTLPIERFIALLRAYGIERLVDIRTMPRSRHNPQFNDTALAGTLRRSIIEYVPMQSLGGLRHARKDSPEHRMAQRKLSRLRRLYANRGISGRARNAHSDESSETRCHHVRRSGAMEVPPFSGCRRARCARRAGDRDFIGEQLSHAQAHAVRAGGRSARLPIRPSKLHYCNSASCFTLAGPPWRPAAEADWRELQNTI